MVKRISDLTKGRDIQSSSKIVVEETKNQQSLVTIKPEGLSSKLFFMLFFAAFWNGFLVVWTTLALSASVLFAAFSIPFWLVGIGILMGIISSLFGVQEFIIRENDLIVRKRIPFNKGETIIAYKDLISIEKKSHLATESKTINSFRMIASSSTDSGLLTQTPVITHKNGTLFFGEHLSNNDKEWLVNYLNDKIVPKMKFITLDSRTTPESHPSNSPLSRDSN